MHIQKNRFCVYEYIITFTYDNDETIHIIINPKEKHLKKARLLYFYAFEEDEESIFDNFMFNMNYYTFKNKN